MLAQERKQYDAAGEFFELALTADPTKAAEVLLAWGIGSLIDERTDEAAKIFQRGIDAKVMPGGNPVFHFYLSGALAAAAENGPRQARCGAWPPPAPRRSSAPIRPASPARVAWLLFRAGATTRPAQAYEKLLEKFARRSECRAANPNRWKPLSPSARPGLELSAACVNLGRLDEAEERLEEVLDDYPDDVEADNDLGFLWADENKHLPRALKMISLAVAAEPDNRAYRDSLGWVYYRLGRYAEAVAELEKAVDEKQPDGTVLDHLGDACSKARQARQSPRRLAAGDCGLREGQGTGEGPESRREVDKQTEENPKSQALNPKQIRKAKSEMSKAVWSIPLSDFRFVSDFVL